MYNYNQHLHFIGLGGVGMAGIAEVLLNLGYSISGSDLRKNKLVTHLESLGAKVSVGHSSDNLPEKTNVVVVSSAINHNNPEIVAAEEKGIPIIPRAEMLAELMRMKYGIAVGGSHGKTTTTSLVAKVLTDAGLDPTVIVGGRLLNQASGASVGYGQYLIAESDESDGSFCLLRPAIAVVTNIDREHLSHYGSFGALEQAFFEFMSSVPFYGLVVACIDDPVVAKLVSLLKRRVVTYGLNPEADFYISDIVVEGRKSSFSLRTPDDKSQQLFIPMPGLHLVKNSVAAIAVGAELGVFVEEAAKALEGFAGVARRTELIADTNGIRVLDDYAHHPTEIRATLAAVRAGYLDSEKGRLIVLFQPHRFSRTQELFSEFVDAFSDADEVIVGDIYQASEEPIEGVTSKKLAEALNHQASSYVANLQDSLPGLRLNLKEGDTVITLGAGNVGEVAHLLGEQLLEKST